MSGRLLLEASHLEAILRQVNEQAPLEACGLLAGKDGRVQAVLPVENVLRSPVRFRMRPEDQLKAFNWIEEHDLDLLAIYHSHPAGPPYPSMTDIEEAAYAVAYLICYPEAGTWQVRGFRIEVEKFKPIELAKIE